MRIAVALPLGALLWLVALVATYGQSAAEPAYTEMFYQSGGLRIQAYGRKTSSYFWVVTWAPKVQVPPAAWTRQSSSDDPRQPGAARGRIPSNASRALRPLYTSAPTARLSIMVGESQIEKFCKAPLHVRDFKL